MAYSRFHPGKFSLWLDWETSGADFTKSYPEQAKIYQGIQLGLVIADNETFEEVASTKITIKFDSKYKWEDKAQQIHGLSREYLEEHGCTREEAAIAVIEFMLEHFNKDVLFMLVDGPVDRNSHRVCFGGHNLEFDISHFKALLEEVGFGVDEHHVKLNTTVLGFHATGMYRSDDLFQLFGAEKRGDHDALEDTRQALAVARGIKALITAGLEATA